MSITATTFSRIALSGISPPVPGSRTEFHHGITKSAARSCSPELKNCNLKVIIHAGFPPESRAETTLPTCTLAVQFSTTEPMLVYRFNPDQKSYCIYTAENDRECLPACYVTKVPTNLLKIFRPQRSKTHAAIKSTPTRTQTPQPIL